MPNINEINSAVFRILNSDEDLTGICSVYKGPKRPSGVVNPSVTVNAKRLAPAGGEGVWMCDVVITIYADMLSNRMPDHETLETVTSLISGLLADTVIELDGGKALPLIEGESSEPEWEYAHDHEALQENTFGLIFIKFS